MDHSVSLNSRLKHLHVWLRVDTGPKLVDASVTFAPWVAAELDGKEYECIKTSNNKK